VELARRDGNPADLEVCPANSDTKPAGSHARRSTTNQDAAGGEADPADPDEEPASSDAVRIVRDAEPVVRKPEGAERTHDPVNSERDRLATMTTGTRAMGERPGATRRRPATTSHRSSPMMFRPFTMRCRSLRMKCRCCGGGSGSHALRVWRQRSRALSCRRPIRNHVACVRARAILSYSQTHRALFARMMTRSRPTTPDRIRVGPARFRECPLDGNRSVCGRHIEGVDIVTDGDALDRDSLEG
jgi:hypothetical protein